MNRIYKPVSCLGLTQGGDMLARAIHANPWMMQDLQPHERWAMESLDALGVVRELKRIFPLLRVVDTFPYDMDGVDELAELLKQVGTNGGRTRWVLTFSSRIQPSSRVHVPTYAADVPLRITNMLTSGLWRLDDVTKFTDWSEFGHQTKGA